MNLVQAMCDRNLFQPWFRGPSWSTWRTVLKAACALPLNAEEKALFHRLAERDPPKSPVSELWTVVGRRGGKDSIASMAAAYYAAFPDYRPHVRPGETPLVLCLAVDRPQARIVRSYAGSYFDEIELLASLKSGVERRDGFELSNGVELSVGVSNFRSVRGRPIPCAILDEVAYWRDADSASPDLEVYNAITPATATMPGALIMGISTPYRKAGLLWERYKYHFGKDGDVLVIKAPSLVMNPTLNPRIVAEALEKDPAAAAAEWLAEFRSDIDGYVDREAIEALVAGGRRELPPASGVRYVGFADAAGGSGGDSFTAAVAHLDRSTNRVVLDAVRERRPPFSPEETIREFAAFFKSYRVSRIRADRWGGEFPVEAFRNNGVACEVSELTKSDIYRECLPLFNSGRVDLLDNPRLVSQICSLERRISRSGKDTIDHPAGPNFHDDLSNAACAALVNAASTTGQLRIPPELIERVRREGMRPKIPGASPWRRKSQPPVFF